VDGVNGTNATIESWVASYNLDSAITNGTGIVTRAMGPTIYTTIPTNMVLGADLTTFPTNGFSGFSVSFLGTNTVTFLSASLSNSAAIPSLTNRYTQIYVKDFGWAKFLGTGKAAP
jgi:hypothetical protein